MIYLSFSQEMQKHANQLKRELSKTIPKLLQCDFLLDEKGELTKASFDLIQCAEAVILVSDGGIFDKRQYVEYRIAFARNIPVNTLLFKTGNKTSNSLLTFSVINDLYPQALEGDIKYFADTENVISDTIVKNNTSILLENNITTMRGSSNPLLPLKLEPIEPDIATGSFLAFKVSSHENTKDRGSSDVWLVWSYVLKINDNYNDYKVVVLDGIDNNSIWVPGVIQSVKFTTIVDHKILDIPQLL